MEKPLYYWMSVDLVMNLSESRIEQHGPDSQSPGNKWHEQTGQLKNAVEKLCNKQLNKAKIVQGIIVRH